MVFILILVLLSVLNSDFVSDKIFAILFSREIPLLSINLGKNNLSVFSDFKDISWRIFLMPGTCSQ